MIMLYGKPLSGHVHRVRLVLSLLKLDYQFEIVSAFTPELRIMNPLAQVPILKDGDLMLTDSNAIMVYLVKQYGATSSYLPDTPCDAVHVRAGCLLLPENYGRDRLPPVWSAFFTKRVNPPMPLNGRRHYSP